LIFVHCSYETDTSSKATPQYDDQENHLDLANFRKTKDFGDFQILTDSPVKKDNRPNRRK
jgi:hypothetical protein